jgi:hypothetical protein
MTGKNFFKSNILQNPCLVNNKTNRTVAGIDLFKGNIPNNEEVQRLCANVTITDLTRDGTNFVSRQDFEQKTNISYTVIQYSNIKTAIKDSWSLIKKAQLTDNGDDRGFSTSEFLNRFKKGSKNFRKILDGMETSKIRIEKNQRVKTFFRLCGLPVPETNNLEKLYAEWTVSAYSTKLRDFSFKFRNNLLGLNTRVAHFNNAVMRACSFCVQTNTGQEPVPDESFEHLFYRCKFTSKLIQSFYEKYLPGWDYNDDIKVRKFIFMGQSHFSDSIDNFFISTVAITLNYFVWQCKLQKKIPVSENWYNELFYAVEIIRRISNNLRVDMSLNLPLCRNWSEESSRRR